MKHLLAPQIHQNQEIVTDINGNIYHTITIGNQTWMIENLKATRFNDGTPITYCKENINKKIFGIFTISEKWSKLSKPAYCFYDHDQKNFEKYGALYNWYAINTGILAPKGWHVPTAEEYLTLRDFLSNNGFNYNDTIGMNGNFIAKAMGDSSVWQSSSSEGALGNNDYSEYINRSGFTALPGGCRESNGTFIYLGSTGFWWIRYNYNLSNAAYSCLHYNAANFLVQLFVGNKNGGMSVRCVKDN